MKIVKNRVLYSFYNHLSYKRGIGYFIDITFKKYMKENEEYIFIGRMCPYNSWTNVFILKSDREKYNKLKKTNSEIFDRIIENPHPLYLKFN